MLAKWNLTVSLLNIFHGALPSLFPNPLHPPHPHCLQENVILSSHSAESLKCRKWQGNGYDQDSYTPHPHSSS